MPFLSTSKTRDNFPKRVMRTGSIADDHNDGRVGQLRTIQDAAGAYKDLIHKEERAQARWSREAHARRQASRAFETDPRAGAPVHEFDHEFFSPSSATRNRPQSATSSVLNARPGSSCGSVVASDFLTVHCSRPAAPSSLPRNRAAIVAAAGAQSSSWPASQIRSGMTRGNVQSALRANALFCDSSSSGDDDDAVSIASTTLSSRRERDALNEKMSQMESVVARSRAETSRMDRDIDELKELLLQRRQREQEERLKLLSQQQGGGNQQQKRTKKLLQPQRM